MNIREWRREVGKYFPDFVLAAEIGLSVVCQLCIKDITNPFGLVYVDVPSSGKTIILNFFARLRDLVVLIDDFTPASFVSHAANRTKDELATIDLLPRIKGKALLVRDLAPLFGKRDDDIMRMMGILTRVFDGEGLLTNSGLHGQRGYEGKHVFMFLAACPPFHPRIWKVMGNFGARLFFYNLNTPDKDYDTLAKQLNAKLSPKKKEKRCRKATAELMQTVFQGIETVKWPLRGTDDKLLREIAKLSTLVSRLRGTINVWQDGSEEEAFSHTAPQIEKPDRINQSFYNLARGHAIACGRTHLTDDDIAIVAKVALNSAPLERVRFFSLLIKNRGSLTTNEIMDNLKLSRTSALRLIKTFIYLEIVTEAEEIDRGLSSVQGRIVTTIQLRQELAWFKSDRFESLIELI